MSKIDSNDLEMRECIRRLLRLNAGALYIRNDIPTGFVVGGVEELKPYQVNEWKESFADIEGALNYFFTKRRQYKIGMDFYA